MSAIDPTTIRLSDQFLLSDFMGCTSVYRFGYANPYRGDWKFTEGKLLAETLEQVSELSNSPLSIAYGYISPELSRRIVRYQSPDKPSYHRWDAGAAADFCAHVWVEGEANSLDNAPISLAWEIDENIPYSRMITYSESSLICFATRANEGDNPRRAFYENRYEGYPGEKPKYINIGGGDRKRRRAKERLLQEGLPAGWKGAGHPTYHIRGIKGYEHYRLSRYFLLSDFLYEKRRVHEGKSLKPPTGARSIKILRDLAKTVDVLVDSIKGKRVSVVQGMTPRWADTASVLVELPASVPRSSLQGLAEELEQTRECTTKVSEQKKRIRISSPHGLKPVNLKGV